MRKARKRQIETLAELLIREQERVIEALYNRDYESASSLLERCQQCAMQLGENIEQAMGEGFKTVALLEEYCEQIYLVYETIESGRAEAASSMQDTLRKISADIRQSIAEDIKIHFEIVFLPFRASAWNSMEKFWKAAKEAPDYEVYVIPVPYYYKAWNGDTLGMRYEGEYFPDEIPITKYDEFDFEKHNPDIIMIHNPYDQYNPVISVHPFFYSDHLKKYTDKLVYTPWFFLDEWTQEDEAALENMNCFVTMPGVINADQVIVQSETMRRTYVGFLTEKAGENTRELWEQKICTFDWPKTESLIPQEWLNKLQKSDGKRKKLVLCSVNISSLIQYEERLLQNLREVFAIFQEYNKEVALLWHSRPLDEENLRILRPRLFTEYDKLVREFHEKDWGIYDHTEQEKETAELCDAYYGSGDASTCFFYRKNRPVWLMNADNDERAVVRQWIEDIQDNCH